MDGKQTISIIHKKARVAREDFDARAMSPAKALRVSLARMADEQLGLALVVSTLEQTRVSTAELLKQLDGQGVLLLLDGAGDTSAVGCMDRQLVTAILEQQISGQVRPEDAADRNYTRTDAAMVAPLLDATLKGYDALLTEHEAAYLPVAFRFGDRVEDTRALSLALDGGQFDLFHLRLDVAEGAKTGVLMLALPHRAKAPKTAADRTSASGNVAASLEKSALEATVPLSAVMARLNMPLNVIRELQPGTVLPLPLGALGQSELVAAPNHAVAEARLGQVNGMRALRVMVRGETGPTGGAVQNREDAPSALGNDLSLSDPAYSPTSDTVDVSALPDLPELPLADLPEMPTTLADLDLPAEDGDFDLALPPALPDLP